MTRPSHPKKEIETALKHAEAEGWRVEVGGSHAWGKIYCPYNDDECRCGEFCISERVEYTEKSRQPRPGNSESGGQVLDPQASRRSGAGGLKNGICFYAEIPTG